MTTVDTFTAMIYVGTREKYSGEVRSVQMAREWLQKHVTDEPLCVTLTKTEFIYTNGSEPGFVIGLINYPRFPSSREALQDRAQRIAAAMLELFKQGKVSVVYPDSTVMLESGK